MVLFYEEQIVGLLFYFEKLFFYLILKCLYAIFKEKRTTTLKSVFHWIWQFVETK